MSPPSTPLSQHCRSRIVPCPSLRCTSLAPPATAAAPVPRAPLASSPTSGEAPEAASTPHAQPRQLSSSTFQLSIEKGKLPTDSLISPFFYGERCLILYFR